MKKYAIVDFNSNEFYPDPAYTDLERIENKIAYLQDYRTKNNMEPSNYGIEVLSPEREAQHATEWARFVSMID
jgi:hypothetical protein